MDINDACVVAKDCGVMYNAAKKILASLNNTKSDRHIVEKNFNQLLQSYRAEILPEVEWME